MSAPPLHQSTIEEVRAKADLFEVVSERVVLRRAGKDYKGLCPFHEDRNPSFYVSPLKQLYKCFSCGVSGDVFKFLMELDKLTFTDATVELARRFGVTVRMARPEQGAEYTRRLSKRQQLGEILDLAAQFYNYALHSERGQQARDYLRARQITEKTIQKFRLGYAPQGWQSLTTYLVEQKRFPAALVEEAGLIVPRNGGQGYYDRFRNRLIIPITDARGQVIAFGGRALGDEQPKYLNSPESELFQKGQTLFALDHAHRAISQFDSAIVVEGYFDAIALHQAGIAHVVATLGTALRSDQVKLLLRYTESKRVVLNFDADTAGVQAAERAIDELKELALTSGVQLRILNLPAGKDPDEYLRAHPPQSYLELVRGAPLWLDWRVERLFAGRDLASSAEFQQVSHQLVGLLSELPSGMARAHYVHRCALQLAQGDGQLSRRIEEELRRRIRRHKWSGERPKKSGPGDESTSYRAEVQLLQIYLNFPEYRTEIHAGLESNELEFAFVPHRQLWQMVVELKEQLDPEADIAVALRTLCAGDGALNARLGQLLWQDETSSVALMRPQMVIRAALANLQIDLCQRRYRYLSQLFIEAFSRRSREEQQYYQAQISAEYQRIERLKKQRTLELGEEGDGVVYQEL
jgi:DNA primase